jgi:hypothetical protein
MYQQHIDQISEEALSYLDWKASVRSLLLLSSIEFNKGAIVSSLHSRNVGADLERLEDVRL